MKAKTMYDMVEPIDTGKQEVKVLFLTNPQAGFQAAEAHRYTHMNLTFFVYVCIYIYTYYNKIKHAAHIHIIQLYFYIYYVYCIL